MRIRKTTTCIRKCMLAACVTAQSFVAAGMASAAGVVTVSSPGPGQLQLTPEALIATHLKVTGYVDARDFGTLKAATMTATQELDLSEATICEYRGTDGSYSPITPDWIVGDERPRLYPAGEMPVHAFTKVGDNSLTKWHYGASITKIILPAGLRSVSPEAFWKMGHLAEIEVPEGSVTARSIGGAVYDRELTRLLAVAPRHTGCLTLPATVTSVADSALHGATLCGIEIKGVATVSFGEQGNVSCPYVIAPNPADYAEAFPGVDVTDKIDEIVVSNAAEGQLARTVGGMGLRAADVRSLTVSGTIGQADVEWLAQLPNLHFLNLAGATFTGSEVAFADNALCSLSLPQGRYALAITDCPFLGGSLTVPEGVTCLSCTGAPMLTAVRLPSTLTDLEPNSFNSSLVAEADLSACTGLASLSGFGSCHRLRTLLLPAGLQVLSGAYGPVETVTLPEGLRELSVGGWNVETLRLPASLERLDINYMLRLRTLDASAATQLREAAGPSYCPLLEEVDFSASPLQQHYGLSFDLLPEGMPDNDTAVPATRVVVTGGIHDGCIHSSLTTLRLPSTLRSISGDGIVGCAKLTELDLQGCAALEGISSLRGLTSLTTLRLPADLRSIEVYDCPALTDIYLAADTAAPGYGDAFGEGVLEAATLHVPIGSRGLYFADADWSRCPQIEEYGYTVRTKSAVEGAVLKGAGLYAPGQEVRIEASATAETRGGKECAFDGWSVGGQDYGAPVAEFAAGANVTATASYAVGKADLDAAHMSFDLTADKPCQVLLDVRSSYGFEIYDGQGRVMLDGGANGATPYSLPAGTTRHAMAIDGPSRVTIRAADAYGSVSMSGLSTQHMPGLLYLEIDGMQLDRIDLSTMPGLYELSLGANALTSLDVSPCLWLRTLSCNMNQLTELDLTENTGLKYLYCEYNRIRRLAFAPEAKLFELGCTGNSFGFSQIPDRMQAAVVNGSIGDGTPVSLWYQPPFAPGTGDLLDLSGELFSADGHPVVISLARDGTEMPPLGGLYAITETGWYSVEMTCTDMPLFTFWGEFSVSGPSAAGRLPLDGVEIGISGLRVNVGGLPEGSRAALFSAAGAHVDVAAGSTPSLAARQPGVYILRLTDGAGRTQAVKLRLE